MVTIIGREVGEGSLPAVEETPESTAPTRACARASVTLPSPAALQAATRRVQAMRGILARAAELLDRPESLVHQHPPTFARARELHHEAAARHNAGVLRAARLIWGYVHVAFIAAPLRFIEWVTETPLRFFGALILVITLWLWS